MAAPEEALSARNVTFTGYEGAEINAYQAPPRATGRSLASSSSTTCPAGTRGPRRSPAVSPPSGYNALCPNLYARQGLDVGPRRRRGGHPRSRRRPRRAVRRRRRARPSSICVRCPTSNGKVGVIGYCSGGRHSFLTAISLPVDAAVDCYGAFVIGTPRGLPAQGHAAGRPHARARAARSSGCSATTTSSPPPSKWTSSRRR